MYLKCYYILPEKPSVPYSYMGTDGKYVVTYKIFIVTSCSVKRKNIRVRHGNASSQNSFLVQELVLNHKLASVVSIAVIKLFYVDA